MVENGVGGAYVRPTWEQSERVTIVVTDDDTSLSGGGASLDGSEQTATATDASGAVIASGKLYIGSVSLVTAPDGTTIHVYEMRIEGYGSPVGYVTDAPITPGVTYTYAGAGSVPAGGVEYGSLDAQAYERDDANTMTGGNFSDSLDGGAGDDVISGGGGNDTLTYGEGNDTVYGGDGNDVIDDISGSQYYGANLLYGGAGDDLIYGGWGNDTIYGDDGNDTIHGEGDDDSIEGGAGNDLIYGGDGNDTIDAGSGSNTVWGGAGDDRIDDETGPILTGGNEFHGGDGDDTIFSGDSADTVYGDAGADRIDAEGGNDSVWGGSGDDTIYAGSGNDTVWGDADNDSIEGGSGDDQLWGGTGDDVLKGGDGVDALYGEEGNDTLDGGAGDDSLWGGDGNDSLWGGDGNDNLSGDAGNDSMNGGLGDDTLWAGTGDDWLWGDGGSDRFYIGNADGYDLIFGGEDGDDSDIDALDFFWASDPVSVTFGGWEFGSYEVGTAGSTGQFWEIEQVVGGTGSDTVDASASGSDAQIYGMAGDDSLTGGSGADTIDGGEGSDTLTGGAGDDVLTGGDGSDSYVFTPGGGDDTVTDFDMTLDADGRTTDRLDTSALQDSDGETVNTWDVTVSDDGAGNAVLTFPTGESVVLMGVSPASISSDETLHAMGVPCLVGGTLIAVPGGWTPVEDLRAGDLVMTETGAQPILWAGARTVGAEEIEADPMLAPVVIQPGALGNRTELRLSRQHCIAVTDPASGRPALVRAGHLAERRGARVRVARGAREVGYHHLLLPAHALLNAGGLLVESLWPGPTALRALGLRAQVELAGALPHLAPAIWGTQPVSALYGPPALPLLPGAEVREGQGPMLPLLPGPSARQAARAEA
ncbi:Hint domain-containing protein (plasmid) [Salipiger sp. H15]|uniref:Hint domain-containing protein n=1 Tax=Alloyangia sp. H15 TaxID=3029062 RepID=A0AAU8APU0_9RHOB